MFLRRKRELPPHLYSDFPLFDDEPQGHSDSRFNANSSRNTTNLSIDTHVRRRGLTTLEALEIIRLRYESDQQNAQIVETPLSGISQQAA